MGTVLAGIWYKYQLWRPRDLKERSNLLWCSDRGPLDVTSVLEELKACTNSKVPHTRAKVVTKLNLQPPNARMLATGRARQLNDGLISCSTIIHHQNTQFYYRTSNKSAIEITWFFKPLPCCPALISFHPLTPKGVDSALSLARGRLSSLIS